MALALWGIGVCCGIAIGKTRSLQGNRLPITRRTIPRSQVGEELERFRQAVVTARRELEAIRAEVHNHIPTDIQAFIDTHLLMLEDATIIGAPIERIRRECCNAEWALQQQRDILLHAFDSMADPYLRSRQEDVNHVVNRIQRALTSNRDEPPDPLNLAGQIVLADDLPPADTLWMQHHGIAGFVTEFGSSMSHTAILARSLGIPAVVGVRGISRFIQENEELILDAKEGLVLADIDMGIRQAYAQRRDANQAHQVALRQLVHQPSVTRDGVAITLLANIDLPEELSAVQQVDAQGVGLYRTEFLFMNRSSPPGEQEQFEAYRSVIQALEGKVLTVRTLDLGAEKGLSSSTGCGSMTTNPALGLRAVRLCLREPRLFRTQLRAILRASVYGPLRLLVPMLTHPQEIYQVKTILAGVQEELAAAKVDFDPNLPLGGMIEVPGAALLAETFARQLDFLSIGTNDLIQYTLAVDRIDDEVNHLYDPLHPAILELIARVIEAGHHTNTPVIMCGEMAGDPRYTRLLLGLGLREFSMHPLGLLEIKRIVQLSDAGELIRGWQNQSAWEAPEPIRDFVDRINQGYL